MRVRGISVVAVALAVLTAALPVEAAAPDREDAIQIFNRDVYVLDGATLRNPTADTSVDAQLYSAVGAALPVTWGEFSAATATSRVRAFGGELRRRTDVRLELTGLIPGGVYSIFYVTFGPDSRHPLCPNAERGLPLTAARPERQQPDPSSVVASSDGTASFWGRVDGDLLDADSLLFTAIYHFDGRTYHPLANRAEFFTQGPDCRASYGEDAMRQLIVIQEGIG